ncbi:unnamed protein product, partial [Rotaria magnacalcarata]
ILVQLFDSNDQPIDENQTNKQVWLNCKKLLINEQFYNVEYNAPAVIKFRFPDIIMTNTTTSAVVELDYGDWEHSLFDCIRLISYNILANGYVSSTGAGEAMYPYCAQEYLRHDYRKPLLLKEILGYHADIISLQECDTTFYERELSLILKANGYLGDFQIKSDNVREGEAIFYRTDRFISINSHSIKIGEYLRDAEHLENIRRRCSLVSEINTHLLERNTAFQ